MHERGLLTEGVRYELLAGQQYWREERQLCLLMRRRPVVPPGGHACDCGFTEEEVLAASASKSFDYRWGMRKGCRACWHEGVLVCRVCWHAAGMLR